MKIQGNAIISISLIALAVPLSVGLTACGESNPAQDAIDSQVQELRDQANEQIEQQTEEARKQAEEALDRVQDQANEAIDQARQQAGVGQDSPPAPSR